jgi:hypothetical protein
MQLCHFKILFQNLLGEIQDRRGILGQSNWQHVQKSNPRLEYEEGVTTRPRLLDIYDTAIIFSRVRK